MSERLSPLPSPAAGVAKATARSAPWNVLPFPDVPETPAPAPAPGPTPLPSWPASSGAETRDFPASWPSPLSTLPVAGPTAEAAPPSPEIPDSRETAAKIPPTTSVSAEPDTPDFTDDDLREAFGPIVEAAVRKAVYAKENGIDTYLEPMLRATIRRALAEYAPASRPFKPPGAFDRFIWHIQALFTSRTYEDIFFEKTRRFQVEEVFLLDGTTLALVSFASCDPARHASVRRVFNTVQRLALQVRDESGAIRTDFPLADGRQAISRKGRHAILVAVVRGQPGELVRDDLEFALRRIEDHFREQFHDEGSPLLYPLQPFLEDCLLIQSPASAA
jgi:hypothetical protein